MKNNPIGIFDSGVGGLTVLKEIVKRLPGEDIVYFGDTAHLPYGNKSPEAVERYSLEVARYFNLKKVKLMVIACNTASVYGIDALREKMEIPVIGVVESGVTAAVSETGDSIGIIGTHGTINSKVYENKILSKNPNVNILSKPCPLFVPLVEEGWVDHPVTRMTAQVYLEEFKDKIDSIILACTHYPLLKEVIKETLGSKVAIVDSATEVAKSVENRITEESLLNDNTDSHNIEFYVSDGPENFMKTGEIFLGNKIDKVELIQV